MPPRKRTRESAGTTSTPAADEDSPMIDAPDSQTSPAKDDYDILKDPWTDEQETSLFKGIVRWKPAGMHKHFRMIALSMFLRNHGYDPKVDVHTRIPGIWEKLGRLYNMPVIDAREDSFDEDEDETPNMSFTEFSLTRHVMDGEDGDEEEDSESNAFRKLIYERVEAKGTSEDAEASPIPVESSPPPQTTTKKRKRGETSTTKTRASTVDDTDEARTSPIAASPTPTTKTGRAARSSKRAAAMVKADTGDKQSKDSGDEEEEEEEEDQDEDEEDEDDEDDDEDEDEDAGSPEPKSTRGKKKSAKATPKSKATASATKKSKPKRKR